MIRFSIPLPLLVALLLPGPATAAQRPNIVVFLAVYLTAEC